jgi:subtilisin family serine protease
MMLLATLVAGCTEQPDFAPAGNPDTTPDAAQTAPFNEQDYTAGFLRILVSDDLAEAMEAAVRNSTAASRPLAAAKALTTDEAVDALRLRSLTRTFAPAGRFEARTRKEKLHLWYDVTFDTQVPVRRAGRALGGVPGVRKVEYRPVARSSDVARYVTTATSGAMAAVTPPFNDPRLPDQWHYYNDGSGGANYVAGADINVFDVWDAGHTGAPAVIVGVIDGGIDYTHEDLAANMWVNAAEKNGQSGVDDDGNGFTDDIHGYNFVSNIGGLRPHDHGTHVAGTIAAVNNNGKGVAGIAGGRGAGGTGVRLMSCQIFVDDDDPYAANAGRNGAPAIKYAADNGAVICQNSWGYPTLSSIPASDKAAIDYFVTYAGLDENGRQEGPMRGGLVLFAAGNENRDAAAPANYERVVAVTSIGPNFKKAYYSNFGDWADIAAPGGDLQAFGNRGTVLSTLVGGYGYMQGTSMACPHASGVAALLLSRFTKTGYNADMLRGRLEQNTTNINTHNPNYQNKLGGLLNVKAAMDGGSDTPPNGVGAVEGSARSNIVTLQWHVPTDPDDGKATGFNVYYRTTPVAGINVNNPPAGVLIQSFSTGARGVGETMQADIKGLDFESTYYFAVNAFDFSGNFSALSPQVTVATTANNAPAITVLDSAQVLMKAHETVVLRFGGADPDGHGLLWRIAPSPAEVSLVTLEGSNAQLTITGAQAAPGTHHLTLTLEDEYGASATQAIAYTVAENHAPELIGALSNVYLGAVGAEKALNLSDYFFDADGEALKYTVRNDAPAVVNVNANKGKLYIVALTYGMAQVVVTATDALGLMVTQPFGILIRDDRQAMDFYPNPVTGTLYLRAGRDIRGTATLHNAAGARVLEQAVEISPFRPAIIDMTPFAGGAYSVTVKYPGGEIKTNIIKL